MYSPPDHAIASQSYKYINQTIPQLRLRANKYLEILKSIEHLIKFTKPDVENLDLLRGLRNQVHELEGNCYPLKEYEK